MSERRKQSVELSIDAELLAEAQALKLDLSILLEKRLDELVQASKETAWLEENREAIEEYNERVRLRGVFGARLRRF